MRYTYTAWGTAVASRNMAPGLEFGFFIDNLLIRNHFIIEMIWWTGLAPWEFECPFPGSIIHTFLSWFGVWVSGLGAEVSGCGVQGSESRISGVRSIAHGRGLRVEGAGNRVRDYNPGSAFRFQGSEFRESGLGFQKHHPLLSVKVSGCRVQGSVIISLD